MTDKRALSPGAEEGALVLKKQKTNGDIVEARTTADVRVHAASRHASTLNNSSLNAQHTTT